MFTSKLRVLTGILLTLSILSGAATTGWKKVDDARDKGLPKTAVEELKPIIAEAMKEKRYAEAAKAICLRIAFECNIEGNKPEEKVTRLEAELAEVPKEVRPLMQAILANWYWHYFQQNRWRFQQRTQTAEAPGKDFTTWDLPRILAEIDKHFTLALANEKQLKNSPVGDYDDLLEKGTMPDAYRPTLFDFLAHEALAFYQAGEQGAAKAEDEFEIDANSPVFGTVAEFIEWQPETTVTRYLHGDARPARPTQSALQHTGEEDTSAKLKAIKLFQKLLIFHQNDDDKTALMDADLLRLRFGKNQAVGPEVDENYKAALKRFVNEWADHKIAARAIHAWASIVRAENDFVEAHKLAKRGADVYPDTRGGNMCYNLMQQIEAPAVNISTERVWNEPWPTIAVNYKNVGKAYFRAIAVDFEKHLKRKRWGGTGVLDGIDWKEREKYIAELIASDPVAEWNASLPPTPDYRERTEDVSIPEDLKPGFYIILASHHAEFKGNNNPVSATAIWVSDLALVVRQRYTQGMLDGFVLQAQTGEPVAGATVKSWLRGRDGHRTTGPETTTDENGMFRFEGTNQTLLIQAEKDDQTVASDNDFRAHRRNPRRPDARTVFFTDRALYRPGQTIQYKGICYRADQEGNNYAVLPGQTLTVVFRDPNGKEIAQQKQKCNDYGAFSGSFTAPGGSVAGRMTLLVQGGPHGSAHFNVEEYKRPKFRVELNRPKEAGKLGAEIVMSGKATAYTGAAIGGAKVKWRVVREVQFPYWCWWGRWWLPPGRGASQNIAHGTATTGPDGTFDVPFTALPDRAIPESTEPTFTFTVYADVTDTTGETRSGNGGIRLGYTALAATISAGEWQTPDKPIVWTIGTTTLDGEAQSAQGTVKVYSLKQPERVIRPALKANRYDYWWFRRNVGRNAEPPADPANPDSWELGEVAAESAFKTDTAGQTKIETSLKPGIYRAMLETKDRFGKTVTARRQLQVVDVKSDRYPVRMPNHFAAPKWSVEPGESFLALWGTGYESGRAYVELEHRGEVLRSFWTGEGATQEVVEMTPTEEMRGGFTIRVTYVRENRAYLNSRVVNVPWSNKQLTVKWEHFTSKLKPGQQDTWTAIITGPDAKTAVAEMVATLYDASLDQYLPHNWMQAFNVFRRESSYVNVQFENSAVGFQNILGGWSQSYRSVPSLTYRHYPAAISTNIWHYGYFGGRERMLQKSGMVMESGAPMPMMAMAEMASDGAVMDVAAARAAPADTMMKADSAPPPPTPDLDQVTARKNLNETAFFFPHLVSDADGIVRMEFTMPEALTEWRFMGFAHDSGLRSGFIGGTTVTAKDLMVEPNPPRFVREGDTIEFTVKVSNQSPARQAGKVRLTFADARTLDDVTADLGIKVAEQTFDVPSMQSRTYSWRMSVPDGMDFLTYKAVGATDRLSDGEEGFLPVLSRRILVTESLPLPIRGAQTKKFEFGKLLKSGKSKTLKNESLTVQMVSQPAWYAVMALPYLMEYPYECSEQIFNRLYANALARYIANADPKIRRIFDLWKNTPALDSPLEKNQDLKSLMIEETPWLRQAKDESQARRNVGILFDANRLDTETRETYDKLARMQLGDGLWPWFPGFRGDPYITLYITTGFGRLRHLGAENVDMALALKSLAALDDWMDERYHNILKSSHPEEYVPSSLDAFYLYGRSFFLKDRPIAAKERPAVDFFLAQAKKFWLQCGWRQSQGHMAIALKRFGDNETPIAIMKSIKERSVSNEELGMFWRDLELSWWWYRAPIETQALMIEAFDEVMGDAQAVEDCKVWLLKQKQTQDWKTTKATADAIYGLLLRGTNLLSSDALVEVSLGGEWIKPENVEAGTGFYEEKFIRKEIKPDMGKIVVKKTDEGVSWGSVHWQYLEDMTKVTPYEGTPLKLKKALYRKINTKKGPVLELVEGTLAVGDELVCRIELRVDRDMEYVHLKDQRGSGTEPVNVLSRTKYQDGLAYYESTRDTASHFFIHYLPKGVYVFEYSVFVQLKGKYQSGIASIQCMYAPEFNSHSESFDIEVE